MTTTIEPESPSKGGLRGPLPIAEVGRRAGLLPEEVVQFGEDRAKLAPGVFERVAERTDGRVVVVTAITPTRAGEGKTTTAIAAAEGLGRIGARALLCLREPSMGPVFGIKGGGAGGGRALLHPMESVNLHFTGDIHAVGAAHNLLAAALDASIFNGNPLGVDPLTVSWPRTVDMDDRALRRVVVGLGGHLHGIPREGSFVITAASEVMAVLALATGIDDLRRRLDRIEVARTREGAPVTAGDLQVAGAMTVLLRDALRPNLVQTVEGDPVLIHTGPFGNIATGNNSVLLDRVARKLAPLVLTEAGFGADLGFEKFCHLVAPLAGTPSGAMVVATLRALRAHGGVPEASCGLPDHDALRRGLDNLRAHVEIVREFGVPALVAVNGFPDDPAGETATVVAAAREMGAVGAVVHTGFTDGGEGAEAMAAALVELAAEHADFEPLNPPGKAIEAQLDTIARRVYGADGVELAPEARRTLRDLDARGLGSLPVCVAKTPASLSHDPARKGRPRGFTVPVRELRPSIGAGFVVALTGDIQLMPGLGRDPAYRRIDVDAAGDTVGLY